MMRNRLLTLCYFLILLDLAGCSTTVSSPSIPGTYTATYSFGDSTLTLEPTGKFTQEVNIKDQPPATAQGTWEFDSARSSIALHGIIPVGDEFDHLKSDWRRTDNFPNIPVERLWFKVNIELSEGHPYIKR